MPYQIKSIQKKERVYLAAVAVVAIVSLLSTTSLIAVGP